MMLRTIAALLVAVLCIGCASTPPAEQSGYDQLCDLVEDALRASGDPALQAEYIEENLQSRISSKDAREAFELLAQINNEERYRVFQQAVENTLCHRWECDAMKRYFS